MSPTCTGVPYSIIMSLVCCQQLAVLIMVAGVADSDWFLRYLQTLLLLNNLKERYHLLWLGIVVLVWKLKLSLKWMFLDAIANTPTSTNFHPLYLPLIVHYLLCICQMLYSNLNYSMQWSMYIKNASSLSLVILSVFPTWFLHLYLVSHKNLPKIFIPVYRSVMILCYSLKWPYFYGLCPSCNYSVVPHFLSRLYFNLQARKTPNLVVPFERAVLSQCNQWLRVVRLRSSPG